MALIKCPECGWEISNKADCCPGCGYPIEKEDKENVLSKCPYCDETIKKKDEYCESCGMKINSNANCQQEQNNYTHNNHEIHNIRTTSVKKNKRGCLNPIIFTVCLIAFMCVILSFTNKGDKKTNINLSNDTEDDTAQKKEDESYSIVNDEASTIDIYYLELYKNYENYIGKYVTISAPIDYVSDDKNFSIKKDIEGLTGMIRVDLDTSYKVEKDKYVTVTGRIDDKILGYLYMKNAVVEDYGKTAKSSYKKQKLKYGKDQADKVEVEQEKLKKEATQFMSECQAYNYDDLRRNPDDYIGAKIKVIVKISQEMDGGLFDDNPYYRCNENDDLDMWIGNEYLIEYSDAYKSSNIITDDIVTVYGEFDGVQEVKRALTKTTEKIPLISAVGIELNN